MTTERQERRTAGVNRVQVARIVDICGRDQTVPAFEAQSVELSGRGMQVRTPYLPPLGAPLVCRLEDGGREIVVEGVVAWQRDRDGGGEFGVQFTALDSGSVEALKSLCGLEPRGEGPAPAAKSEAAPPEAAPAIAPCGTPVKLHIDGLGAPMKARVKTGSVRKLQVGSNLEFLKVGRGLEVEDVEQGERRGARIDSVSIAIDPETQVPQLVVMLRYAGEDTTPEPSVVDGEDEDEDESNAGSVAELRAALASEASAPASVDDASDEDDDAAAAMRGRMDAFAVNVGRAAKNTSDKLAVAGGAAAAGFARFLKDKGGRLGEMAAKRAKGTPKKRSTAPAPATTTSSGQQRLRPQNGGEADGTLADPKRRKVLIGAGVGVALTLAVGAMALSGRSSKTQTASSNAATGVAAETSDSVAATPGALPALGATPPAMAAAPASPGAMAGAPGSPAGANTGIPGQRPGVVANVPLFGPTPMATLEPAPLGPAPDQIAPLTATAAAAQQPATEERMEDDEKASSSDESFGGGSSKDNDKKDKSPEALAEAVKPFVQGKLHLPLLHRLKLDKPGTAIQGKKDVAGFTVVIPGRKVEGGGSSIAKRDDRISEVRTKNGPGGAQISFIFRSKIPGYKVRLKKSSVEFFISSPDNAK